MKVVKHKGLNIRKPNAREEMRKALMDLYRDAQFGRRVEADNRPLMRSARFIGSLAGRMQRIFTTALFKILIALLALYLLIHWTGISLEIHHDAVLLFKIK